MQVRQRFGADDSMAVRDPMTVHSRERIERRTGNAGAEAGVPEAVFFAAAHGAAATYMSGST